MYAMLDSIILKRRDGEVVCDDFLQTLLRKHAKGATDEEEEKYNSSKLTDSQLKDNILTLLVAGHDTTTAALTWLLKFLGENPEILQKLRVKFIYFILFCGFGNITPKLYSMQYWPTKI